MNDTAAILAALDLPPEALAPFLAHIEQFCQAHGGERRYAELLAWSNAARPPREIQRTAASDRHGRPKAR